MKFAAIRPPGWAENGNTTSTVLVELTAKRWKGLLLLAFATGLLGIVLISWQIWEDVYRPFLIPGFKLETTELDGFREVFFGPAGAIGIFFLTASSILGIYARFMAWWRHG